MADEIVIPDKPAFKVAEVCDLLKVQPYVLKTWEIEFKDLGVPTTPGGPRVYRRTDVQKAVRIRELVLHEGLTLAGVRRRLDQESGAADAEDALIAELTSGTAPAAPAVSDEDRRRVGQVKQGLRALLDQLLRPAVAVDARRASVPVSPIPEEPASHRRELKVVADDGPSLFGEEPAVESERTDPAAPSKSTRRRRPVATPSTDAR